jgi:hypothetical protein
MPSSVMFSPVALVGTDVSEEPSASIRVTRISELGTTLAVTSNRRTLRRVLLFDRVHPAEYLHHSFETRIFAFVSVTRQSCAIALPYRWHCIVP